MSLFVANRSAQLALKRSLTQLNKRTENSLLISQNFALFSTLKDAGNKKEDNTNAKTDHKTNGQKASESLNAVPIKKTFGYQGRIPVVNTVPVSVKPKHNVAFANNVPVKKTSASVNAPVKNTFTGNYNTALEDCKKWVELKDYAKFGASLKTIVYDTRSETLKKSDIFPLLTPEFIDGYDKNVTLLFHQLPKVGIHANYKECRVVYRGLMSRVFAAHSIPTSSKIDRTSRSTTSETSPAGYSDNIEDVSATSSSAPVDRVTKNNNFIKEKLPLPAYRIDPRNLNGMLKGFSNGSFHKHWMGKEERVQLLQLVESTFSGSTLRQLETTMDLLFQLGALLLCITYVWQVV